MRGGRIPSGVLPWWLLAIAVATLVTGSARASDQAQGCATAKNRAGAHAFSCLVRRHNTLLSGGTADLGTCGEKLSHIFATLELTGSCPLTGDYAQVQQRLNDAEAGLLAALEASMADTDRAKRCVVAKNKAAAAYALCIANEARQSGAVNCGGTEILKPEAKNGCLTTGDTEALAALASQAATYLVGADLSGLNWQMFFFPLTIGGGGGNFVLKPAQLPNANLASTNLSGADLTLTELPNADLTAADLTNTGLDGVDLTNANFSNANLVGTVLFGANLTNADFTNANLTQVLWANNSETTTCPDGTTITAASTPPSCCEHMNGHAPAACSP
jgi:uncharacterized protein YjbI with pentapeptide repeats